MRRLPVVHRATMEFVRNKESGSGASFSRLFLQYKFDNFPYLGAVIVDELSHMG